MSQCWQEGDWRAYLDGELPSEATAEGRAHLEHCRACAGMHREIAERAARIGALMLELETVPAVARRAGRSNWKWAAAAVALAAALAAAFVLTPRRVEAPTVAHTQAPAAAPVVAPTPVVTPVPVLASQPRPVRAARRRVQQQLQYFLALDEEPIDTGTVMRVTLENGIQADVIVDSGGRARAIRTVSAVR